MTPEEYMQLSMTGIMPDQMQDPSAQPAPVVNPATPQQSGLGALIAKIAPALGNKLSGLGSGTSPCLLLKASMNSPAS